MSLIFHRIGIDTLEVLQAAGTKWNFLPFRPGLVGGHCIGVDPYYLTHKAEMLGLPPAGHFGGSPHQRRHGQVHRRTNRQTDDPERRSRQGADVIVLGLTFKENCPDLRNSKVIDVINELKSYGVNVHVHDPVAFARRSPARVRCRSGQLGSPAQGSRDCVGRGP